MKKEKMLGIISVLFSLVMLIGFVIFSISDSQLTPILIFISGFTKSFFIFLSGSILIGVVGIFYLTYKNNKFSKKSLIFLITAITLETLAFFILVWIKEQHLGLGAIGVAIIWFLPVHVLGTLSAIISFITTLKSINKVRS